MSTLNAGKDEAGGADPKRLLAAMMNIDEFENIPVLILDSDALQNSGSRVEQYVLSRVAQSPHASILAEALTFRRGQFLEALHKAHKARRAVSPAMWPYRKKTQDRAGATLDAAIITAPGKDYSPEVFLSKILLGPVPHNRKPIMRDDTTFRVQVLFHELAHVVRATEPQADKISALFCRRSFPNSISPQIFSDLRAVEAMVRAAMLVRKPKIVATEVKKKAWDEVREGLLNYGWPMVLAGDSVMKIPQHEIAGMSDADILSVLQEKPEDDHLLPIFMLAALANQKKFFFFPNPVESLIRSNDIQKVAEGANLLERKITSLTGDPAYIGVAKRFTLAARRLSAGEAAYQTPSQMPKP